MADNNDTRLERVTEVLWNALKPAFSGDPHYTKREAEGLARDVLKALDEGEASRDG